MPKLRLLFKAELEEIASITPTAGMFIVVSVLLIQEKTFFLRIITKLKKKKKLID